MLAEKMSNRAELVYHCSDMVGQWVMNELGRPINDEFHALGLVLEGRLIAGAIYHNYTGFMVEISAATTDKRFCNRRVLNAVFDYAFGHLGCERVNMICSKKNKSMRKFAEGLGFKQEGCHKKGHDGIVDAISYGMLKDECKWI